MLNRIFSTLFILILVNLIAFFGLREFYFEGDEHYKSILLNNIAMETKNNLLDFNDIKNDAFNSLDKAELMLGYDNNKLNDVFKNKKLYRAFYVYDMQEHLKYKIGEAINNFNVKSSPKKCDDFTIRRLSTKKNNVSSRDINRIAIVKKVCTVSGDYITLLSMDLGYVMKTLTYGLILNGNTSFSTLSGACIIGRCPSEDGISPAEIAAIKNYRIYKNNDVMFSTKINEGGKEYYFNYFVNHDDVNGYIKGVRGEAYKNLLFIHVLISVVVLVFIKLFSLLIIHFKHGVFGHFSEANPIAILNKEQHMLYCNKEFDYIIKNKDINTHYIENLLSLNDIFTRFTFYKKLYLERIMQSDIMVVINKDECEYNARISLSTRREERYIISLNNISSYVTREKDITGQLNKDYLTSLYNRKYFDEALAQQAIKHRLPDTGVSYLMLVDVDDFKHINDTRGHAVGDDVLKHLAQDMLQSVRENDLVFRIGGDEFAIIINDIEISEKSGETIGNIAERLLKAVSENNDIPVSISIGIAPISGDAATIFQVADRNLYFVKNNSKNGYSY